MFAISSLGGIIIALDLLEILASEVTYCVEWDIFLCSLAGCLVVVAINYVICCSFVHIAQRLLWLLLQANVDGFDHRICAIFEL